MLVEEVSERAIRTETNGVIIAGLRVMIAFAVQVVSRQLIAAGVLIFAIHAQAQEAQSAP